MNDKLLFVGKIVICLNSVLLSLHVFLHPFVSVWQENIRYQTELAKAESDWQVAVLDAVARKRTAKELTSGPTNRDEQADKLIVDSLTADPI